MIIRPTDDNIKRVIVENNCIIITTGKQAFHLFKRALSWISALLEDMEHGPGQGSAKKAIYEDRRSS